MRLIWFGRTWENETDLVWKDKERTDLISKDDEFCETNLICKDKRNWDRFDLEGRGKETSENCFIWKDKKTWVIWFERTRKMRLTSFRKKREAETDDILTVKRNCETGLRLRAGTYLRSRGWGFIICSWRVSNIEHHTIFISFQSKSLSMQICVGTDFVVLREFVVWWLVCRVSSLDVILCGRLGSEHQQTLSLSLCPPPRAVESCWRRN